MAVSHRTARYVMILGAIAAGGGCRSSGEPVGLLLRGSFVLHTVNNGPLPADISIQSENQVILLADTLRFQGNGLMEMSRTERVQSSTSGPTVEHNTADFRVRLVGETIYLDFLCPPGADCVSTPITGHLVDANTLMLGDLRRYVYVRR